MALLGKNFCTSAREGFAMFMSNATIFIIVGGIGHIFIFLGKGFICLLSSLICYGIITNAAYY